MVIYYVWLSCQIVIILQTDFAKRTPEQNGKNSIHKAQGGGNLSKHPRRDLLLTRSTKLGREQPRKSLICGKGSLKGTPRPRAFHWWKNKGNCTNICRKKIISSVTKLRTFHNWFRVLYNYQGKVSGEYRLQSYSEREVWRSEFKDCPFLSLKKKISSVCVCVWFPGAG